MKVRRYEEKVAWITGSGSGIGRAIAVRMASEGARVLVSDISEAGCNETASLIEAEGGECAVSICDVTDLEQCVASVASAEAKWGHLDVAVANAGIVNFGSVEYVSESDYLHLLDINLHGVFRTVKAAIPALRRSGGGAIALTSSVEGLVGNPMLPAYVAAKTGVIGLCRSAAAECAPAGIRVNCVNPGYIQSPMTNPLNESLGIGDHMMAITPMGRLGVPEDVASVVAFLCSDDAGYVTGQTLAVDGGMTAVR